MLQPAISSRYSHMASAPTSPWGATIWWGKKRRVYVTPSGDHSRWDWHKCHPLHGACRYYKKVSPCGKAGVTVSIFRFNLKNCTCKFMSHNYLKAPWATNLKKKSYRTFFSHHLLQYCSQKPNYSFGCQDFWPVSVSPSVWFLDNHLKTCICFLCL